jgi:hypothetical protein
MSLTTQSTTTTSVSTRHLGPAFALIVLAPLIGEVLSGSTRISFIFAFVPEMMVWGCGALIIRESVRRWNGGWTSVLLLGLALSVAEEFVIQQTSVAPLPGPAISASYGRFWGVNWIYFLFMLAYESVWIVLVPIQVTELIFAKRRNERWLSNRGLVVAGLVFAIGSFMAWYAWIKRARPIVFHAPNYIVPYETILAGVLAIVLLALMAYAVRRVGQTAQLESRMAPPVWMVGSAALVLGFPWYRLMTLIFGLRSLTPFWIPVIAGVSWAAFGYLLIRYWSSSAGWGDLHRWALTFGAVLVCMAAGFLGSKAWPRVDLVGKWVLNVIAVFGFVWLWYQIRRRVVA